MSLLVDTLNTWGSKSFLLLLSSLEARRRHLLPWRIKRRSNQRKVVRVRFCLSQAFIQVCNKCRCFIGDSVIFKFPSLFSFINCASGEGLSLSVNTALPFSTLLFTKLVMALLFFSLPLLNGQVQGPICSCQQAKDGGSPQVCPLWVLPASFLLLWGSERLG